MWATRSIHSSHALSAKDKYEWVCTYAHYPWLIHLYLCAYVYIFVLNTNMNESRITCICTAYCIWSVVFAFSNLNRWSSSLGLLYHVPLKRDQGDRDWRLRLNDTPNAIGCINMPTNTLTGINTHEYRCISLHIHTYIYVWTHTHALTHTFTHVNTNTQAHRHTDTQTRTHSHTITQKHRNIDTQTHKHPPSPNTPHTQSLSHMHTQIDL